jgi:outer membrane protein assembly factor BamB
VADGERLEKGPAYRESMTAAPAKPEEWPTYRQNSKRTSGTTAALKWPVSEAPEWKAEFGERITAPSIAQGRLFAAIVNQGRIVALDAATGKVVWTRVAGPRIDTPPTVHGDQVLFGSHDGYLYALRASDGALAWRFFAAPERRRMVACDRVESAWPLMGSALVADGVLYAVAGRITRADGGMHLYALDPVNGAMKWHRTLSGTRGPELATGIPCWRELEGQMMNNMLVCDGDELRLPDEHQVWQFSARTGDWMPRKAPAPLPDQPADSGASFLAWYSEAFPWLGYDRPTVGWLMHGMDPVAELRHPYEAGTPSCYPAADRLGLIVKRMRRSSEGPHSVLIPTRAGDVAQTWAEEKSKVALPWKPAKLMSSANPNSDVYALVAAGETVVLACTSFAPPQQAGELRALSLKDGQELPSVALPATPAYDGMAAAYGKLFVTLRDGRLLCLGGK